MDLGQYVELVITNIVAGVKAAQTATNPGRMDSSEAIVVYDQHRTQNIRFDVAIAVSESSTTSGKAGIRVASIGGDAGHERSNLMTSSNRVQFDIPVCLPIHSQSRKP
ncbi:MAG: hypothetical protein KIT19_07965 [Phycisphaeraceae bacterium]|nr:hypothetical protein [Phycisphaeraceae bacterium]